MPPSTKTYYAGHLKPIGHPSGAAHRAHRAIGCHRAPSGDRAIRRRFVAFLDYRIQCPSGAKIPSGFCLHRARYRRDKIHFAACNQDHRARRPIGPIGRGSPSGSSGIQLHRAHRALSGTRWHTAEISIGEKSPSGKIVHRAHRAK